MLHMMLLRATPATPAFADQNSHKNILRQTIQNLTFVIPVSVTKRHFVTNSNQKTSAGLWQNKASVFSYIQCPAIHAQDMEKTDALFCHRPSQPIFLMPLQSTHSSPKMQTHKHESAESLSLSPPAVLHTSYPESDSVHPAPYPPDSALLPVGKP